MAVHQLYLTAIVRLIRHYIPESVDAPDQRMYQIAAKITFDDVYFGGKFDLALAAMFLALPYMAKAEPRIRTGRQVMAYMRKCRTQSKFYTAAERLAYKTPILIDRLLDKNQNPGEITPAMLMSASERRNLDKEAPIKSMRECMDDLTGDLFKNQNGG